MLHQVLNPVQYYYHLYSKIGEHDVPGCTSLIHVHTNK